jgi:CDP-diacylglycerol--glycerol-3-phosphate 3-phosphatidyltransferase
LEAGNVPNLPNSISFFRILLIPVLMVFLLAGIPNGDIVALAVFVVAALTDSIDGYLARRQRSVTVMGAFLDPLADKLLVSAALISLVQLERLSAWVAMVIIAREFAVSGLRMIAAARNTIISASVWGKSKTLLQVLAIVAYIIEPRLRGLGWRTGPHSVAWYLMLVAVIATVLSGIDYFVKARRQLGEGPRKRATAPRADLTEPAASPDDRAATERAAADKAEGAHRVAGADGS